MLAPLSLFYTNNVQYIYTNQRTLNKYICQTEFFCIIKQYMEGYDIRTVQEIFDHSLREIDSIQFIPNLSSLYLTG